ncbi:bifunctional 5,10-methylene-tetrahydrofolate dehydrogenase/5,10-methylene-tetrahydrofolate cyclohydrolase [Candidatus Uhrbacteria bacterium]|nr:bifunctional 5,10-methylene-tetrahydrofolate dehydrogenase/5,10-methylene-tetrahydrofolate cyclohydrolase [Candidatus Uhrbacteria bacterium]
MSTQLLDGKKIADGIRAQIRTDLQRSGVAPGLAVLLVGNDPASHLYVSLKEKAAKEVGIHFEKYLFFAATPEAELIQKILELNRRTDIHGILVQVPLPDPLSEDRLIAAIDPKKDADGFHPKNIDALLAGITTIVPSVIRGILALIEATHVPLAGKHAIILANSFAFAQPIRKMLTDCNVSTDIDRSTTSPGDVGLHHPEMCTYDIVITARGIPKSVTPDMVKEGAIVIDVGTTLVDGKIRGDVHPDVAKKSGWLTPVPGGVGPMTVAYLLRNVVDASLSG